MRASKRWSWRSRCPRDSGLRPKTIVSSLESRVAAALWASPVAIRLRRDARGPTRPPDPRNALGSAAETAAAELLVRAGFRIVARNVRIAGAEIDLVAVDGDEIVFVEVRSRSGSRQGGPLATIGRE